MSRFWVNPLGHVVASPGFFTYPDKRVRPLICDALIPTILFCPKCGRQHVDRDEGDMDWSQHPHKTHLCHYCQGLFRPYNQYYTIGVDTCGLYPKFEAFNAGYQIYTETPGWLEAVVRLFGTKVSEQYQADGDRGLCIFYLSGRLLFRRYLFLVGPVITVPRRAVRNLGKVVADLQQGIEALTQTRAQSEEVSLEGDPRTQVYESLRVQGVGHIYEQLKNGISAEWDNNGEQRQGQSTSVEEDRQADKEAG